MTFKLVNHDKDTERDGLSRAEAQEAKQHMRELGAPENALEIVREDASEAPEESDGADNAKVEPTASDGVQTATVVPEEEPIPEGKPDIQDDPVDWMPSHFIDEIQGVPTLNRKGYAVMAERFNVSVTAEPVVRASETEFQHAEFKAIATTKDGTEYSGFGSAHVNRGDGDDEYLLNELAETRAMKRAASWALGLGMTAKEEMENSL